MNPSEYDPRHLSPENLISRFAVAAEKRVTSATPEERGLWEFKFLDLQREMRHRLTRTVVHE